MTRRFSVFMCALASLAAFCGASATEVTMSWYSYHKANQRCSELITYAHSDIGWEADFCESQILPSITAPSGSETIDWAATFRDASQRHVRLLEAIACNSLLQEHCPIGQAHMRTEAQALAFYADRTLDPDISIEVRESNMKGYIKSLRWTQGTLGWIDDYLLGKREEKSLKYVPAE